MLIAVSFVAVTIGPMKHLLMGLVLGLFVVTGSALSLHRTTLQAAKVPRWYTACSRVVAWVALLIGFIVAAAALFGTWARLAGVVSS